MSAIQTTRPMVYFCISDSLCRIGYSTDVGRRTRTHGGYGLRFYAAICGTKDHEAQVHQHFNALRVDGTDELFKLEEPLREYLDWLGSQPFAAVELTDEEIQGAYPCPHRFPWARERRDGSYGQGRLAFDDFVPGVRKPLTRSQRVLATIRSDSDEWTTPPIYVNAAREVMGGIDLDPASNPLANCIVRARSIYTIAEDGLRYQWHGRVWMNPPYGNLKDKFVEHLICEYEAGRVEQAVLCLNSHAIDSIWFQQLWRYPVCLTHHRPKFEGGRRNLSNTECAPTTGIAFVYVGADNARFCDVFSRFGPVVKSVHPASVSAEEFRALQSSGADWRLAAEA